MQLRLLVRICIVSSLFVMFTPQSTYGRPTFEDGISWISQFKSLFQWIGGDAEGVRKTQENFSRQAPFVAQTRAIVELALGKKEEARKTQQKFEKDFIQPIVNNI